MSHVVNANMKVNVNCYMSECELPNDLSECELLHANMIWVNANMKGAVSYTHLTLPTILLV